MVPDEYIRIIKQIKDLALQVRENYDGYANNFNVQSNINWIEQAAETLIYELNN